MRPTVHSGRLGGVNPLLHALGGYPLARFSDLKAQLAASGAPLYDFSVGDPVEPTPAFVREALVTALDPVSQYPSVVGSSELRAVIAGWVQRRFGVAVDPEREVLPTAGSKEAIFHLPLALVDSASARRAVVWGDPGYPVYGRGQQFAGGVSDPVALTADAGWLLELDELAPDRLDAACLAWTNYPHNPTGAIADLAYHRRQLVTARDRGIVLGSDECYADIHPEGGPVPPSALQAADGDLTGLVVAFSLSKRSGMTGYRCGALVGDPALIADQRLLRPNLGTASPQFVQQASIAAWSDDAHVADRRAVFDAKREVVLGFLAEAGIEVSGSAATFYVWFRAPGGDDAAYAEALLSRRVIASPGRAFGPAGTGWLRLALVPSVEGCREAVALWRGALEDGLLPT